MKTKIKKIYSISFCKFRSNGWNEWTDDTLLGSAETKAIAFDWSEKNYPDIPVLLKKRTGFGTTYVNRNGERVVDIPYRDHIMIETMNVIVRDI